MGMEWIMDRRGFLKRLLVVPAVPLMGKDMNFQEPEQVENNGYTQFTHQVPISASNQWIGDWPNCAASAVFYTGNEYSWNGE